MNIFKKFWLNCEFRLIRSRELNGAIRMNSITRDLLRKGLGRNPEAVLFKFYVNYRENYRFKIDSTYRDILTVASALNFINELENFLKTSIYERLSIEVLKETINAPLDSLFCLVEFHKIAGYPEVGLVDWEFIDELNRSHAARSSDDFKKTLSIIRNSLVSTSDRVGITALMILREMYGDEPIIELSSRMESENFAIPLILFPAFLKDWGSLKTMPLSWSSETIDQTIADKFEKVCVQNTTQHLR